VLTTKVFDFVLIKLKRKSYMLPSNIHPPKQGERERFPPAKKNRSMIGLFLALLPSLSTTPA
jgi:hypothetical protein